MYKQFNAASCIYIYAALYIYSLYSMGPRGGTTGRQLIIRPHIHRASHIYIPPLGYIPISRALPELVQYSEMHGAIFFSGMPVQQR